MPGVSAPPPGLWAGLGYLAGGNITVTYDQVRRYELYLLVAAAVVAIALIAPHLLRRHPGRGKDSSERAGRLAARRCSGPRSVSLASWCCAARLPVHLTRGDN